MEFKTPALLRQATFTIAVNNLPQLPDDSGLEVGFAGRSNAGKSSAINTITGIHSLARTSKTPGRTQQIIYFTLDETRRLVDLPGYGYAKVPLAVKKHWHQLMEGYFKKRESLKGLVLVMDVRHPLKEFDEQMLNWCLTTNTPVHVLLTKADKLSKGAASSQMHMVIREIKAMGLADAEVQLFSSLKRTGTIPVTTKISQWLDLDSIAE